MSESQPSQEIKQASANRMWPFVPYQRWITDTPKGLKRYDVLAYVGASLPALTAGGIWEWARINDIVKTEPAQFGFAMIASFLGFTAVLGKRKKDTLERKTRQDYGKGVEDTYSQWRDSAAMIQGGVAMTYRFVEAVQAGSDREAGEGAVAQNLQVVALAVRHVFGDQPKRVLVSIAVPVEGQRMLTTAKFHTEAPGRHPGSPIQLRGKRRGAAQAFLKGQPDYVSDNQEGDLAEEYPNRTYRSFMSWPVKSGRGKTVAVVNIDSEVPNGFDGENDKTRRTQALWMSEAALTCIAIALLDKKTFERYRCGTN